MSVTSEELNISTDLRPNYFVLGNYKICNFYFSLTREVLKKEELIINDVNCVLFYLDSAYDLSISIFVNENRNISK